MEINEISENKENENNNNQKVNFFKKVKIPYNVFKNEISNNNESNNKILVKSFVKINHIDDDIYNNNNNIDNNLITEGEGDLDIELHSVSKKIPINDFINIDEMKPIYTLQREKNEKEKENQNESDKKNKKKGVIFEKFQNIKKAPSATSFFDDIKYDDQFNINNNNNNNTNINDNCPQFSEFNMTNFGLSNRPKIYSNFPTDKEDISNKTNNNKIYNNNNSIYKKKEECRIRRHNSVINPNINKFLDINNDTIVTNTDNKFINNNHNQFLYDEIQKLKKENKKLFLKNNELTLKLKTQETKSKTNNNYNNINQKKLSCHKEEFFLQKIKKLESEIIKQKDLITKLSYNKRFNIGIRKIRVNSILIKGNNNKIKRKNSLCSLHCNNGIYRKMSNQNQNINLNNTLPNRLNKFIKKKSQNLKNNKSNKKEKSIQIKAGYSSISSSPKNNNINKENKDSSKISHNNKNTVINLKLENIDNLNNYKKTIKEKFKEKKVNKIDKITNEEIKSNDEYNNTKVNNANNNYKKLAPHKTYGKTSLIMSVINDNLLGNFNLTQYLNEHTDINNKNNTKKLNPKRNSIY